MGGGEKQMLAHIDRLTGLQRQRDHLPGLVARKCDMARALRFGHDNRQARKHPAKRPRQRHAPNLNRRILPKHRMMREINSVAGGQIKIRHGNVESFDLAGGGADAQLGHVADGRKLRPAGVGRARRAPDRSSAAGAGEIRNAYRRPAPSTLTDAGMGGGRGGHHGLAWGRSEKPVAKNHAVRRTDIFNRPLWAPRRQRQRPHYFRPAWRWMQAQADACKFAALVSRGVLLPHPRASVPLRFKFIFSLAYNSKNFLATVGGLGYS